MKKKNSEKTHTGGASLAVHVEQWIQRVGNPQCWADQGPIENSTIWVSQSYSSLLRFHNNQNGVTKLDP